MDYKIVGVDARIGQIQVNYFTVNNPDGWTFALDVPIIDGAFISGAALDAEIQSRTPLWLAQRSTEVAAADFSVVASLVFTPELTLQQQAEKAHREAKFARAAAVEAITVTVGDKVFDGDETSQTRMARAIIGLQAAGVSSLNWTLANNESVLVTVVELTEALILAGQAQAALWPIA